MASTNRQVDQLAGGENAKTNKINDIVNQIEAFITETTDLSTMTDADFTVLDASFDRNLRLTIPASVVLTADRKILLPDNRKALLLVKNDSTGGFKILVQNFAQTGARVEVPSGNTGLVYYDGVDVFVTSSFQRAAFGTVALPSYSFNGDADTGMYRISANVLGFATGGVERLRIDSTGFSFSGVLSLDDGTAGAPSLSFTSDPNTGLFRVGVDILGIAAGGIEVTRFTAPSGVNPQVLVPDGTVALPVIAFATEPGTGWYRPTAQEASFAIEGNEMLRLHRVGGANPQAFFPSGNTVLPGIAAIGDEDTGFNIQGNVINVITGGGSRGSFFAQILWSNGSAGTPTYSFLTDLDIGMFRIAADRLGFSTAGVLAIEIDAAGQLDLLLQFRSKATRAGLQTITTATPTDVLLTAEDYDVGTMHDTVTNPDRITIPTDGNGIYMCIANVEFASNATGDRALNITLNGVVTNAFEIPASSGVIRLAVSVDLDLVATDIVRMQVVQDSGGNLNVTNSTLSVRKVT